MSQLFSFKCFCPSWCITQSRVTTRRRVPQNTTEGSRLADPGRKAWKPLLFPLAVALDKGQHTVHYTRSFLAHPAASHRPDPGPVALSSSHPRPDGLSWLPPCHRCPLGKLPPWPGQRGSNSCICAEMDRVGRVCTVFVLLRCFFFKSQFRLFYVGLGSHNRKVVLVGMSCMRWC